MPDNTLSLREEIVDYAERLYDRDLVGSTQGNLSVRFDSSRILITPTGCNLGYLSASDIVIITEKGKKVGGSAKPSSEYDAHLQIYKARKDVKAICHAHPLAVTALSITQTSLNKLVMPEIIHEFGNIPLVEYCTPGTPELYEKISKYVANHDVFILRNHGAITLGKDLEQAFNRMEMLERYAWILTKAMQIGRIREIPIKMARKVPGYDRIEDQLSS